MIRVKDLKDQIGIDANNVVVNNPVLVCPRCHETYSANKGDYWNASPDYVFKHCRRNMVLAVKRIVFEEVQP